MDDSLTSAIAGLSNSFNQLSLAAYSDVSNKKAIRRQNEANKDLAKYQYDMQVQQWERANEYNSPRMQMQRYQDAGLNPNLIYGNGSSSAGLSASSSPEYNAPEIHPVSSAMPNTLNAASSLLDQALKVSQIEKTTQETKNLGVYQRNMRLEGDLKELDKIGKGYANAKSKEEAEVWRDLYDNKIINMRAQGQLMDSQRFRIDAERDFINGPKTSLSLAELGLTEYRKSLISAQIQDLFASVGLKAAQSAKISREIANLGMDYLLKGATLTSKNIENRINSILLHNDIDIREKGIFGLAQKVSHMVRRYVGNFIDLPDDILYDHSNGAGGSW